MKNLLRKIGAKLVLKLLKQVHITAAAVIVIQEIQGVKRLALVKEKSRPELEDIGGLLNLPTEQMELGETVFSCAGRAGKEEAGVEVRLAGLLPPFHISKIFGWVNMTVFVYTTEIISGSVEDFMFAGRYPSDIENVHLIPIELIESLHKQKRLMPYVWPALQKSLSGSVLPLDSIVELSA